MLLNRFQRLFGHNESMVDHANWVTDRQQIIRIMQRLQQNRCLLEARISKNPEIFSTAVIGINPKTGIMALDEIAPTNGHKLFMKHGIIHLSGRSDGVEVEFDLEYIAERSQAGIAYYQVGIPKAVIYLQRRDIHRVPLNGAPAFRGQRGTNDQQILSGYASDVSLHGIGIVLKKFVSLHKGEELTTCLVEIPGNKPIYFGLEIRFAQQIPHRRTTRIGGRFLDLSKHERNRLKKIILQMERKHAALGVR